MYCQFCCLSDLLILGIRSLQLETRAANLLPQKFLQLAHTIPALGRDLKRLHAVLRSQLLQCRQRVMVEPISLGGQHSAPLERAAWRVQFHLLEQHRERLPHVFLRLRAVEHVQQELGSFNMAQEMMTQPPVQVGTLDQPR
eukprot:TRINITY_DN30942_c0_g1_i2.p1 TRINITY_DN30942_c0_g1~~TRINITY_DN30942_c0_g1_i2.p1  ORF type:complete len:141 (-),score=26.22 TRINITY_DN30942_c0_g1_i2:114-536(-)